MAYAIHSGQTDTELEALAEGAGWSTLAGGAGPVLADGTTTLAEVLRVVTL